jgi:hypothetical protein
MQYPDPRLGRASRTSHADLDPVTRGPQNYLSACSEDPGQQNTAHRLIFNFSSAKVLPSIFIVNTEYFMQVLLPALDPRNEEHFRPRRNRLEIAGLVVFAVDRDRGFFLQVLAQARI